MKWIDCAEDTKARNAKAQALARQQGRPPPDDERYVEGVAYRSEDGRWRVVAESPEAKTWAVYDMRDGAKYVLMSRGWRRVQTALVLAELLARRKTLRVALSVRRIFQALVATWHRI